VTVRHHVMATFDDVSRLTADLPEVAEATSLGTPALAVRGKSFCRLWSVREHARDGVRDTEVLVVFCDLEEKPALIESSGGALFSTPHYDGYGAMLVRLGDIGLDDLADVLEDSYRLKAPASLRKALDGD
jgi:hypothetical protein